MIMPWIKVTMSKNMAANRGSDILLQKLQALLTRVSQGASDELPIQSRNLTQPEEEIHYFQPFL